MFCMIGLEAPFSCQWLMGEHLRHVHLLAELEAASFLLLVHYVPHMHNVLPPGAGGTVTYHETHVPIVGIHCELAGQQQ